MSKATSFPNIHPLYKRAKARMWIKKDHFVGEHKMV